MRLGVLGGGQLAQMLAQAGLPLGLHLQFIDPSAEACAARAAQHLRAAYDDPTALQQLAEENAAITFEFENVPSGSLEYLEPLCPTHPSPRALASGQDRLEENQLFQQLGIAVAAFLPVDDLQGLQASVAQIGLPCLLKVRREGYDGKGQAVIRDHQDLTPAWHSVGQRPAIIEALVPFQREVSLLAVRSQSGAMRFYPLTENLHQKGILFRSVARFDDPMQALAEQQTQRLMEHLDYVGVLALEFFQLDDVLLANEFAPRVHNSGHWTLDGAETSQFENHLRAVAGLPLGSTRLLCPSAMLNCIGQLPPAAEVLAIEGAHLHDYGKAARPGRKVGHINITAADEQTLSRALQQAESLVVRHNLL